MYPPVWIQVNATAYHSRWQDLVEQPSFQTVPPLGSRFAKAQRCVQNVKAHCSMELLAQFALDSALTRACLTLLVQLLVDAASSKGLTMTQAVAAVLTPYFKFKRRYQVFPHITHIPGRLNMLADELSRFKDTLSIALRTIVPWM